MFGRSLLMTMALTLAAADDQATAPPADVTIEKCQVASLQNLLVPGSDSGALVSLAVKEGQYVTKDMELARVDDREARAMAIVKQLDFEVAEQKANSNIEVRHAQKSADVAEQAYKKLEMANATLKSTITAIEMIKTKFEWEKAKLSIEKAEEEVISNKLTAKAKKAEVDAALVTVNRRILRAPFNGVVIKIMRREGEWVAPGDPVMQVVRIDRLRIYGDLDASKWGPADVEGRKVTVEVMLPRGQTVKVPGKIVFVSPVVGVGLKLPLWAEIDTPMDGERPLVRAGLEAKMTIHVNEVADEAPPAATSPAKPASRKAPTKS
jgi:multidrug resistance efflux pump